MFTVLQQSFSCSIFRKISLVIATISRVENGKENGNIYQDHFIHESSKRADLQGLRGVAILLVLVMHLIPKSCSFGFVGVDIFFVLSGYLMSRILLREEITAVSILDFYRRRFKRIVPLCMMNAVITYACKIYFCKRYS
ncbi:unnamed protein product [Cylicostephanus goldi]|uniref:Acyltransferase 3 domain-containing protein n=1 Tax=Cylicostephanus goldi TaxID=71465 RepID=A0A3P6RNJ6_CYLGO|nr:unnamed protein product [Cylicostephanus goldi]